MLGLRVIKVKERVLVYSWNDDGVDGGGDYDDGDSIEWYLGKQ